MGLDVGQQPLKRWPFRRSSGIAAVIIEGGKGNPALVPLTLYICVTGLALGMQGIEILFQSLLGGFWCKSRSERLWWGMERAYARRLPTLVFRGETGAASASGTASNLLRRGPAAFLFEDGARLMPKKAYPFQLVPVIALATAESDL